MNSYEEEILLAMLKKAELELENAKVELKPIQKKERLEKKKIKKIIQEERKAKNAEMKKAMKSVNRRIEREKERIHRISKIRTKTIHLVQGGSPGLGKKS
ncbi:hypothetical protein [Microbulbifer epialgicus]|uniref:Uncharacterized protein n=1 Tax=Microbulbifer epialgicus TaxID=393907 RepID=A0ABV4P3K8_9GAMM